MAGIGREEFGHYMEALVRACNVRVDSTDMNLWWGALNGYSRADLDVATGNLIGKGTFIALPTIVAAVRELRAARLAQAKAMPVPATPPQDTKAYQGWVLAWREAILAGEGQEAATAVADGWAKQAGVYDGRSAARRTATPSPAAAELVARHADAIAAKGVAAQHT